MICVSDTRFLLGAKSILLYTFVYTKMHEVVPAECDLQVAHFCQKTPTGTYLHNANVVSTVDFTVLRQLLTQGSDRVLKVLSLSGILLLDICIHACCIRLMIENRASLV